MRFNSRIQFQTNDENLFSKNSIGNYNQTKYLAFDDSWKVFEGNPSFDSKEIPESSWTNGQRSQSQMKDVGVRINNL